MRDMDRKARDKARHLARRDARRAKVAVIGAAAAPAAEGG